MLLDFALGADEEVTNLTTNAVQQELTRNQLNPPAWAQPTAMDGLDALPLLGRWSAIIGSGIHNRGELTVFACAELIDGVAIVDDRRAAKVARKHGATVHGSLWVIAQAIRRGKVTEAAAEGFVDEMIRHGARYPCTGAQLGAWMRKGGLLP